MHQSKLFNSIKLVLNDSGNPNLWISENIVSGDWVKLSLGLKLNDIFKQNCHEEVFENRLYK